MVKMGPYFGRRSLTTYMKARRWRATWKRFPTTGQPGGPGGRFFSPPPVLLQRRHQSAAVRAAARRKTMSERSIAGMESASSLSSILALTMLGIEE